MMKIKVCPVSAVIIVITLLNTENCQTAVTVTIWYVSPFEIMTHPLTTPHSKIPELPLTASTN